MTKLLRRLVFVVALLSPGCSPEEEAATSSVMTVGVLPDEQDEALRYRYGPLMAYLGEELGKEMRLVIPESYARLVDLFGSGEVDVAYFGGTTFVASLAKYGAVPVVMRDIDTDFSSYFLVRAGESARTIEEFGGRSFAFGSELSTSGHLMPRYFLREQGITPETFFASVRYSGAHDKTVAWVRDGLTDLAVANAEVVETMLRDGRLAPGALRILWETPPYSDYVWAVRPGLGEACAQSLRDAFLALSSLDAREAEILGRMGTEGFLPARVEDFTRLESIMSGLPQFQEMLAASPD